MHSWIQIPIIDGAVKNKKYQIRANSVKSCLLFLNALVQKIHIDGTDNIKKKLMKHRCGM